MATKQTEENELRFPVANNKTIEELKRFSENKNTRKMHGKLDECFQKMGR